MEGSNGRMRSKMTTKYLYGVFEWSAHKVFVSKIANENLASLEQFKRFDFNLREIRVRLHFSFFMTTMLVQATTMFSQARPPAYLEIIISMEQTTNKQKWNEAQNKNMMMLLLLVFFLLETVLCFPLAVEFQPVDWLCASNACLIAIALYPKESFQ